MRRDEDSLVLVLLLGIGMLGLAAGRFAAVRIEAKLVPVSVGWAMRRMARIR
jgi:hypothetical protein